MKLYVKQKVFSFRDRFTVTDDLGRTRYYVAGELISLGKKLHIFDDHEREIALVRQKLLTLMPRFYIDFYGGPTVEIRKRFTVLKPRYEIERFGWAVEGSFLEHDYSIFQGSRQVAYVHKVWMSWGDSFEIDISDPRDEVTAIAVVLAIDCVMDSQNSAASASSSSGSY